MTDTLNNDLKTAGETMIRLRAALADLSTGQALVVRDDEIDGWPLYCEVTALPEQPNSAPRFLVEIDRPAQVELGVEALQQSEEYAGVSTVAGVISALGLADQFASGSEEDESEAPSLREACEAAWEHFHGLKRTTGVVHPMLATLRTALAADDNA